MQFQLCFAIPHSPDYLSQIAANVAADVVDVKVVDNNVANDVLNYNVVDVLHRRGVADVDALTKQGAGAVAGVAAVAAPVCVL